MGHPGTLLVATLAAACLPFELPPIPPPVPPRLVAVALIPPAPVAAAPDTVLPPEAALDDPPMLTAAEADALIMRGDSFLSAGDVTSARYFYQYAAGHGSSLGALRLGTTYDPEFLTQAGLRAVGHGPSAVFWYRRARELGNSDAEILLRAMEPPR